MKKCETQNCSNEGVRSFQIAPGTNVWLCLGCVEKNSYDSLVGKENTITSTKLEGISYTPSENNKYIFLLIDDNINSVRPDNFNDVYLLSWKKAKIEIPWKEDDSPKKAILRWAINELFPIDD